MAERIEWPVGKVVIHKLGSLIRGTVVSNQAFADTNDPDGLRVRITRDSGEIDEISLEDAKAMFFVRSFTGRAKHEDLSFYDEAATAAFLWTRITFLDGEVIECMVPNSKEVMLAPAFFATPVDPEANNLSMYIVKKTIKQFQILAVRNLPPQSDASLSAALCPEIESSL